jgi:hypothetical protein
LAPTSHYAVTISSYNKDDDDVNNEDIASGPLILRCHIRGKYDDKLHSNADEDGGAAELPMVEMYKIHWH